MRALLLLLLLLLLPFAQLMISRGPRIESQVEYGEPSGQRHLQSRCSTDASHRRQPHCRCVRGRVSGSSDAR